MLTFAQPTTDRPPPKPSAYELEWDAPPNCPETGAIRARIEELLPVLPGSDGTMLIHASVRERARGFEVDLSTTFLEQAHVRHLEAPSCGSLAESTALLVVAALETGTVPLAPASSPSPVEGSVVEPSTSHIASSIAERSSETHVVAPSIERVSEVDSAEPLQVLTERPSNPRSSQPFDVLIRLAPTLEYGATPGFGGFVSNCAGSMFGRTAGLDPAVPGGSISLAPWV